MQGFRGFGFKVRRCRVSRVQGVGLDPKGDEVVIRFILLHLSHTRSHNGNLRELLRMPTHIVP